MDNDILNLKKKIYKPLITTAITVTRIASVRSNHCKIQKLIIKV